MNEQLESYARESLKEGLAKLPDGWQRKFKLMYASGNCVEEKEGIPIVDVVDNMPSDKLDWAMSQVENSLKKLNP